MLATVCRVNAAVERVTASGYNRVIVTVTAAICRVVTGTDQSQSCQTVMIGFEFMSGMN